MKKIIFLTLFLLLVTAPAQFTSNSRVSASGNVTQTGRPDLVVKEISFDESPSQIRVRVLNQGTGDAESCYLALQSLVGNNVELATKQRVWTIQVPALAAGKGFSNTIDIAPLSQTNGPWRATIDRSNSVAESIETNNSLSYPMTNPGPMTPSRRLPDLVIDHFTLTDASTGEVTVAVKNKGVANSTECTLRLIVWEPGQFEHKEAKTVFVKVQALHGGQSTIVKAQAGAPIINTKYSLFIDISEEVKEANEDNNRGEGEAGNFKP